jgi:hypothetical protein
MLSGEAITSRHKPGDQSLMRIGSGNVYDKRNIFMVICDAVEVTTGT